GLGVPKDRIKLLTGAEARKLDVEKALLTWLKPLVAGGKSDVYVFFSGHGLASDDGRDLFLLPYDGDRSLLDRSAIRRKELVDAIVGAGAASATLFLDTCYSGGTRSGETLVASARPVLLAAKEEAVPANVTILTAAANDQLSSTLPATGHGLFSYYLMRGLEGEASGGGRSLTASDLLGYLSSRIPPEAAKLVFVSVARQICSSRFGAAGQDVEVRKCLWFQTVTQSRN
ncbi:caspase family protein, partial [Magnetospirillum sp. UT-4]|uniref:caspase family protein n=1 Tax=Magnetospirillum sp. UT-4 TaxID=2681467 RepID=UPI001573A778